METIFSHLWRFLCFVALAAAGFYPFTANAADEDAQVWSAANVKLALGDGFAAVLEGHARFADDAGRLSVTQVRAGLLYELTPAVAVSAGYWHVWSYSDDEPDTEENRLWQDLTWRPKRIAGFSPALRTRLEQSFPSGGGDAGWRLRQQAKLTRPLNPSSSAYLYGSGEAFFNLVDTGRADSGFEQVRLSAGAGFRLGEHVRMETGYLNQFQPRKGAEDRINHVLLMTFSFEP